MDSQGAVFPPRIFDGCTHPPKFDRPAGGNASWVELRRAPPIFGNERARRAPVLDEALVVIQLRGDCVGALRIFTAHEDDVFPRHILFWVTSRSLLWTN